MSKYQPRIFINNPEKNVPDDIREQFFLTIRSGDIDKIRDFANKYKNKYNIIEKSGKGSASDSGKTPFHVVLELDDKVASVDTKLNIMKFLDLMGAPMDLPDSADIWPIHLAAALQSEEIVDFLLKKKVIINRKDSSNNTPLHYAINGKDIACPHKKTVGSLVPSQKIDELTLNQSLENANSTLIKLVSQTDVLNNNLIHMINTIMKIPEMYADDKFSRELQAEIITIFSDIASTPTYSSDNDRTNFGDLTVQQSKLEQLIDKPNFGDLTVQQNKLEQLIDRTYSTINEGILNGLTNPIDIAPNNNGWGPKIPTETGVSRSPNNLERIMPEETTDIVRSINERYTTQKNLVSNITNTQIDGTLRLLVPKLISLIDTEYIDKLIFCKNCDAINYGEEVTLTKMFYLLTWNSVIINIRNFADRIMQRFSLMNQTLNSQIMENTYTNTFAWATDIEGVLFRNNLDFLIDDDKFVSVQTAADIYIKNLAIENAKTPGNNDLVCIRDSLINLFTNSDDTIANPIDVKLQNSLGTDKFSALLEEPQYVQYKTEFYRLSKNRDIKLNFRNPELTWFIMLGKFIRKIKPKPSAGKPNIFEFRPNIYIVPPTPLPKIGNKPATTIPVLGVTYTWYEIFRVMHMLQQFILDGSYRATAFPEIFLSPIGLWQNYLDELSEKPIYIAGRLAPGTSAAPVKRTYREFIFLYRILVTAAQQDIKRVIEECIVKIITNNAYTTVNELLNNLTSLDDVYMYSLLLPSEPNVNEFMQDPDPYLNLKAHKWLPESNDLIKWFNIFQQKIPVDLFKKITEIFLPHTDIFTYATLNDIRQTIEYHVAENITDKSSVFGTISGEFRTTVKQYFGSQGVIAEYNTITGTIKLDNVTDRNFRKLSLTPKIITDLNFLTENYGYFFVTIKQLLIKFLSELTKITDIISNIIYFIRNETFYHIPQIFLPALVEQVILVLSLSFQIRENLTSFVKKQSEYYVLIDVTGEFNSSIIDLGNDFADTVINNFNEIYKNIVDVLAYHNEIINFLNINSANQLINSSPNIPDDDLTRKTSKMFTMNLIPIENFSDVFTEIPDYTLIEKNLRQYRIPKIAYHGNDQPGVNSKIGVFGANYDVEIAAPSNIFTFRKMTNNIISYARSSTTVSNSPVAGENLQINITADANFNPSIITINDIPEAIEGEWLKFNPQDIDNTQYSDAFISYNHLDFQYEWLNGMPPSIRDLVAQHLRILKQKTIEDVIQYIIDNSQSGDPNANQDLVKLYNNIRVLGNDKTYTKLAELDPTKIHIVIGKLLDTMINKLMEYSIRQSISEWIYQFATSDYKFRNLTTNINKTINIIRQQDYLKLSLQDINEDAVKELLKIDSKYIDYKLSYIEPDPENINFTTKQIPPEFIHFLYNIDYFSSTDIGNNKKCYQINPLIAAKLITNDTINSKNSDGNTPLHMAVNMDHSELVELLIAHGANPKSFKNIHGLTPYNFGLTRMEEHLKYTAGPKVIDSINNFVVAFNDLMIARLSEDKYNNNIIKNITLGIPILLVIYNHMFYLYLQNYRYGFTIELKDSVMALYKKYYLSDKYLYPLDIFDITDKNAIKKIIEPNNPKTKIKSVVNAANRDKIEYHQRAKQHLINQIDGLKKEKDKTTDTDQIKFIGDLLSVLELELTGKDAKITSLEITENPIIDDSLVRAFIHTVDGIDNKIDNRSITITDFYDVGFGRIGYSKELYLGIWNNYLQKKLNQAPTMIFSQMFSVIDQIISFSKQDEMDAERKADLTTISEFFKGVSDYIESKESYPTNLLDNPILKEEFSQIIYLINLILTPAIRNIWLNHVYQGLREAEGADAILRNQYAILDEITNTKFGGYSINTYLSERLPLLAAKYFTGIYIGGNDSDRKITNGNDLFLPLIQIVKANKSVQLNDESILIQNLRDTLVPFMVNTYHYFIHHLRLAIYGYERYLLGTYQQVRILQSLI